MSKLMLTPEDMGYLKELHITPEEGLALVAYWESRWADAAINAERWYREARNSEIKLNEALEREAATRVALWCFVLITAWLACVLVWVCTK